ncbi:hypothetical protein BO86DRAFT_180229 [Aspergillus japonicus CBS 114.51]|uniref:Uncharacterized protein n=1 Tax=Aspergillus japonicus CBS 114.51 TaxID=1448312 RepID=A0A8T8WRL8_ASPJA|nr:hypothetical protein BO86DRAFT_180229 [Aspergillus japonicus CBS 114.51]RAH78486.1 hypothetical protein BO86DRAFT_180229 [Aspergillus japonicus CBS 114.51]
MVQPNLFLPRRGHSHRGLADVSRCRCAQIFAPLGSTVGRQWQSTRACLTTVGPAITEHLASMEGWNAVKGSLDGIVHLLPAYSNRFPLFFLGRFLREPAGRLGLLLLCQMPTAHQFIQYCIDDGSSIPYLIWSPTIQISIPPEPGFQPYAQTPEFIE